MSWRTLPVLEGPPIEGSDGWTNQGHDASSSTHQVANQLMGLSAPTGQNDCLTEPVLQGLVQGRTSEEVDRLLMPPPPSPTNRFGFLRKDLQLRPMFPERLKHNQPNSLSEAFMKDQLTKSLLQQTTPPHLRNMSSESLIKPAPNEASFLSHHTLKSSGIQVMQPYPDDHPESEMSRRKAAALLMLREPSSKSPRSRRGRRFNWQPDSRLMDYREMAKDFKASRQRSKRRGKGPGDTHLKPSLSTGKFSLSEELPDGCGPSGDDGSVDSLVTSSPPTIISSSQKSSHFPHPSRISPKQHHRRVLALQRDDDAGFLQDFLAKQTLSDQDAIEKAAAEGRRRKLRASRPSRQKFLVISRARLRGGADDDSAATQEDEIKQEPSGNTEASPPRGIHEMSSTSDLERNETSPPQDDQLENEGEATRWSQGESFVPPTMNPRDSLNPDFLDRLLATRLPSMTLGNSALSNTSVEGEANGASGQARPKPVAMERGSSDSGPMFPGPYSSNFAPATPESQTQAGDTPVGSDVDYVLKRYEDHQSSDSGANRSSSVVSLPIAAKRERTSSIPDNEPVKASEASKKKKKQKREKDE